MDETTMEELLIEHGPIVDVEDWNFGQIITFSDGFTVSRTKEEHDE